MKEVIYSSQFRRDLKRYRNKPKMVQAVVSTINMLQYGIILPENMRPHILVGNYKGCMECHVGGDLLLIWRDETTNVIRLLRLGSHSELF